MRFKEVQESDFPRQWIISKEEIVFRTKFVNW